MPELLPPGIHRFKALADLLPVGIFSADLKGRFAYANASWKSLTGLRPEGLTVEAWLQHIPTPDQDAVAEAWACLVRKNLPFSTEHRHLHTDGRTRILYLQAVPEYNDVAEVAGYLGTVTDVTDQRQVEARELTLSRILEASLNELYFFSADTLRFLQVNHGARTNLGYTMDELRGMTPLDIKPDYTAEDFNLLLEPLRSGEHEKVHFTTRHRRKDGSLYPVEVHLHLSALDETPVFVAVILDITERELAQEALRNNEAQLREAQQVAHVGSYAFDLRTLELTWSDELSRIYGGIWPEDFGGDLEKLFNASVHPEDQAIAFQSWQHIMEGQGGSTTEFRIIQPDGTEVMVSVRGTLIHDAQGTPIRAVGAIQDITERKRAEEAYRQAQETLLQHHEQETERAEAELEKLKDKLVHQTRLMTIGQMAASVAHELRNPLGAVRNATFILKQRTPAENQEQKKYLDIIEQEVGATNRIITHMLEIGRFRELQRKEVDLSALLQEAVIRVREMGTTEVTCRLDPTPFIVQGDPHLLQQVLDNLLRNAVQAMQRTGQIYVSGRYRDGFAELTIRDEGPGVLPEQRAEIFEPLYTTKARGTGLGLPICRQILEQHGGTLELVENDLPGAAFRFRLPR